MSVFFFFRSCSSQKESCIIFVHNGKIVFILYCCHSRLTVIYLALFMSSERRHPSATCCQYHPFQSFCWSPGDQHPPCCLRCSLKQAHREPTLIWKAGSFCKRALYFNCIHFNGINLIRFLSQALIFSHNKGWRKFSEWKSWTSLFHCQGLRDAQKPLWITLLL